MKFELTETEKSLRNELMNNIEKVNNCELICQQSFQTLWLHNNDYSVEFRYVIFLNKLIISRVCFSERRRGCMSLCLNTIKKYAQKLNLTTLVIQSVQTKEMANFCIKNNILPNEYCMEIEGIFVGDYECSL